MTRTAVLLGAGASRDAGMPLTVDLADELITRMNTAPNQKSSAGLLNFVFGAMLSKVTQAGGDPHTAVNVETMFSAIRLLRDRASHEVSPFVQAWNPAVAALDQADVVENSRLSTALKDSVGKAIGDRYGQRGHGLLRAVQSVVRQETGAGGDGSAYRRLELRLRELIVEILTDRLDSGRLSYLSPIIELALDQPLGVDVISLNYDLTIETAAKARKVDVNRGIETWRPGEDLDFEATAGRLNLIKPHGSVDWVIDTLHGDGMALPQQYTRGKSAQSASGGPAVVIGDREKLESEGATLALMRGFETAMRRADRLVIVGYSGADSHVNAVIRDWINAGFSRSIIAIDPTWPRLGEHRKTFRGELTANLGVSDDPTEVPRRLAVLRKTAAEGIVEGLSMRPSVDPGRWFSVEPVLNGAIVDLTVTNVGPSLDVTSFYPRAVGPTEIVRSWPDRIEVRHADAVESPQLVHSVAIPHMQSGERVVVHLEYGDHAAARAWFLQITGTRDIGQVQEDHFSQEQHGVGTGVPN
ncbi:hypothetical protein BH11ACT4_BH11ACT4_06870 [soil metagenome]